MSCCKHLPKDKTERFSSGRFLRNDTHVEINIVTFFTNRELLEGNDLGAHVSAQNGPILA